MGPSTPGHSTGKKSSATSPTWLSSDVRAPRCASGVTSSARAVYAVMRSASPADL